MKLTKFDDVVNYINRVELTKGKDKIIPLSKAISRYIKSGMKIHIGITHAFPYAACNEIARKFWRKDPKFTVATLGAVNHIIIWLYGKMIKKLVTSYCGDVYPAPAPNPIFSRVYTSGEVEIKNWTLLTYSLRMLAGAMGLPFIPTKSLIGSSMVKENIDKIELLNDPEGGTVCLLKPFIPDISIYHAWASDRFGNSLFVPPYSENVWGAISAKEGTIITAEKIVDTSFIKKYNHLVKLPGSYVKAVCHVPMGAHPGGYFGGGIPEFESYAEDYDFIVEFRDANRKNETFDLWLKKWLFDVTDHDDYLKKLGYERILFLKGKAYENSWESELASLEENISEEESFNETEFMTVAAAREIVKSVKNNNYNMILAGQGNSNIAAWIAYYKLREEDYPCELIAEAGFFGYAPRPGNPFLFNFANIPSCKLLTDSLHTLGIFGGGRDNRCIGSLSAGQIDKHGNINSTLIPGLSYIVGSGGSNDVANSSKEVIVTMPLSPVRFVEKVPYVTAVGENIKTLVTNKGIFKKDEKGELILTSILKFSKDSSNEKLIKEIQEMVGWNVKVSSSLEEIEPPTLFELKMLRCFDPRRSFLKS